MGRLRDLADTFTGRGYQGLERSSFTTYSLSDYLNLVSYANNGNTYTLPVTQTWQTSREAPLAHNFESLTRMAYMKNPVVWAAVQTRAMVFSEIDFKYRNLSDKKLYGGPGLVPLEQPAPNKTTGELLFQMEQDISLDGNWYGTNRFGGITRLRPDWVTIALRSDYQPNDPGFAADATVDGYFYKPGGPGSDHEEIVFGVDEIAHFSPVPDPSLHCRGLSWVEVVTRELMADSAGTTLRLKFYENGATPNMVIEAPEYVATQEQFDDYRKAMEAKTAGVDNGFRTLYLANGSSATSVGLGLNEISFAELQGRGETRIAVAAKTPAALLGISEGLAGSALSQAFLTQVRRIFADGFLRPEWRMACACLSKFASVPAGSELWYDEAAVAFLRDDAKDAAEVATGQAAAIRQFIDGGFDPDSAVRAVQAQDLSLLSHTGLLSVQLQDPTKTPDPTNGGPDTGVIEDGT